MIQKTKAIVLNTIKYGDTSLIATCYTEKYGLKSYLLKGVLRSKKGGVKAAYFQPLMQLCLTARHNDKGYLNTIREIEINHFYQSVYTDIKKQTIALFLAEILYRTIKEEEENTSLFKYLETAFLWLDTHDHIANFHLLFLLKLTKFLGFYPSTSLEKEGYFDLLEGQFTASSNQHTITGKKLDSFRKILGTHFDVLEGVGFSAENRQDLLSILIQYFELHLTGFIKPKSLAVLSAVFKSV